MKHERMVIIIKILLFFYGICLPVSDCLKTGKFAIKHNSTTVHFGTSFGTLEVRSEVQCAVECNADIVCCSAVFDTLVHTCILDLFCFPETTVSYTKNVLHKRILEGMLLTAFHDFHLVNLVKTPILFCKISVAQFMFYLFFSIVFVVNDVSISVSILFIYLCVYISYF